jgi:hypothetical protein
MLGRRTLVVLLVALTSLMVGFRGLAGGPGPTEPGTAKNFTLVGHDPLMNRGMNAAPAMYGHYLYIGSRTDGSHPNAGVLVVDVGDPAHPNVVNQIGPPDEGLPTMTSRELRVWPQQKALLVMNFQCSAALHACASAADAFGSFVYNIDFYDLSDPANPALVASYVPSRVPHEMFLWVDPKLPAKRALLYMSTPTSSVDQPNMIVTDISGWHGAKFPEIAEWNGNKYFAPKQLDQLDVREHSMDVSPDGTRTYVAYLGGGLVILDSSRLAAGTGTKLKLVSKPAASPHWKNMTVHTAEKVPGRDLLLTTDELYGDILTPIQVNKHGCPWGWVHMVDISNPARPKVVGQFQDYENTQKFCSTDAQPGSPNDELTSYAAHNPTILGSLAFVTWHSDGLQAIDLSDPAHPTQAGFFSPEPEAAVVTEDPMLSSGGSKVVVWSYPIISNGLVYIVDIRNGLYVLRYTGPDHDLVDGVAFLEGNSNLGDAARLER